MLMLIFCFSWTKSSKSEKKKLLAHRKKIELEIGKTFKMKIFKWQFNNKAIAKQAERFLKVKIREFYFIFCNVHPLTSTWTAFRHVLNLAFAIREIIIDYAYTYICLPKKSLILCCFMPAWLKSTLSVGAGMSFFEVFIFNRVSFCFVIFEINAKAISHGSKNILLQVTRVRTLKTSSKKNESSDPLRAEKRAFIEKPIFSLRCDNKQKKFSSTKSDGNFQSQI